ncbi:CyP450 monooxygenase [Trametes meyenii]|nr:CyP450 monooxygenase [Trametes meyenii]
MELSSPFDSFDQLKILVSLFALVLLCYSGRYGYLGARKRLAFPPGPRPLPLIGNAFDMPMSNIGASFVDMAAKYGDVVYMNVIGQPMVILGSFKAFNELLESKSAISSDRPYSPMTEMTGFAQWDFALMGYNPSWRARRRAFHQHFNANASVNYRPMQLRLVQRLLQKLATSPEGFIHHIHHYFGSSTMTIVYGLDIANDAKDRYLVIAQKAMDIFLKYMTPGRYVVESVHSLRHVPSWFPGAGFKRFAIASRKDAAAVRDVPFDAMLDNIASGTARSCVATALLEAQGDVPEDEARNYQDLVKDVAAIAYFAGVDTTFTSVVAFFLAMTNFPDVQAKAQAELDAVVGPERLPNFDDRPALPYINALVKECLRWHVVVPLGVPHRTTEDESCNGYFIPKGTVVMTNAWGISRDPTEYPNPEEFRPERFLDPKVRDPATFVFGAGRRVCAGRHFANASLFIVVASVLHTLKIEAPLDGSGNPVAVEPKVTTHTFLSYPEPFKCRITPRSPKAGALIQAEGSFGDD